MPVQVRPSAPQWSEQWSTFRPTKCRLLAQPMRFRKREKPCDVGLFDTEGRKQMELSKLG